jgi:hypothetical protein
MKTIWRKKPTVSVTCDWQKWNDNNPNPDILSISEERALRLAWITHSDRECACFAGGN